MVVSVPEHDFLVKVIVSQHDRINLPNAAEYVYGFKQGLMLLSHFLGVVVETVVDEVGMEVENLQRVHAHLDFVDFRDVVA